MAATVAASGMAMLDATVVTVAIPRIGDDFDAGVSSLRWVLTGYLLALSSLILLAGAVGDRFGRRRVFVLGTVWFAAASMACGAAPNIEVMLVLSAASGSLAQRIGPRPQMTIGPLVLAAGLLLLARVGPGASWPVDVLPGALVLGLGLVVFVAPLTGAVGAAQVTHAFRVALVIAAVAAAAAAPLDFFGLRARSRAR